MFNKFVKKFNLKKSIVAMLCFAFAITVSFGVMFFVNNSNNSIQEHSTQVSEIVSNPENHNQPLIVKWSKEEKQSNGFSNLQPTTVTNPTKTDYTVTLSGATDSDSFPSTIPGGTKVTVPTFNETTIEIIFSQNSSRIAKAVFTTIGDKIFTSLTLGNSTNEAVKTVTTANSTGWTVEVLDPNYAGNLVFKAVTETPAPPPEDFKLKVLPDAKNRSGSGAALINYGTVSGHLEKFNDTYKTTFKQVDEYKNFDWNYYYTSSNFLYWGVSISYLETFNLDYSVTTELDLVINENDVEVLRFKLKHENLYMLGVNNYYYIIDTDASINVTGSKELNVALVHGIWKDPYLATIKNGDDEAPFWKNQGIATNSLKDYRGVKTASTASAKDTSATISFYTGVSERFFFPDNAMQKGGNNVKYEPYNYGHKLTGYYVHVSSTSYTGYLKYDSGWSKLNSTKSIGVSSDGVGYGTLAWYFDNNSISSPTITITPHWEAISIYVSKNGESNKLHNTDYITFGSQYTLNAPDQSSIVGGNFFCYYNTENGNKWLIANNAVWNYDNLSYGKLGDIYHCKVDVFALDNVYRVNLGSVISSNKNILENTVYSYASSPNTTSQSGETKTYLDLMTQSLTDYSASGYKLAKDYASNTMQNYINTYNEGIDGVGTGDFDVFNKVYYSAGTVSKTTNDNDTLTQANPTMWIYLANNKATNQLPMFKNDRAKIIAWTENSNAHTTNGYTTGTSGTQNLSAELTGLTQPQNRIWLYTNSSSVSFSAKYVYSVGLYYLNNNSTYSVKNAEWYGINTKLETPFTETFNQADKLTGSTFECWMFNANAATAAPYNYPVDTSTAGLLKVTVNGVMLTFEYDTTKGVSNGYYLGLKSVQGGAIFAQNATNPIITAKYSSTYQITIDNTKAYWKDFALDNQSNLYGAVSSSETTNDGNDAKTTIVISASSSYAYPFQNSNAIAFFDKTKYDYEVQENINKNKQSLLNSYVDSTNEYYYVYNYGHYIKGWQISYGGQLYVCDGTSWSLGDTGSYSLIANLNNKGITFVSLASELNRRFPAVLNFDVTITPVWEATTISVKLDGNSKGSATFGYKANNYSLSAGPASVGQTFFCYNQGGNFIANSADVWNYTNLSYEYVSGTTYSVAVVATYLDNVYRIDLKDVLPSSIYELENTGFTFASTKNTTSTAGEVKTCSDLAGELTSYSRSAYPLIENYATTVITTYFNTYISSINGGDDDYEIFRKVNYSDGTVSGGILTATSPNLWIYLANNQLIGANLPMFKHEYAKIIAWKTGTIAYKTSGFTDDLVGELDGFAPNSNGKWVYSAANSQEFSAAYVYRLKLYYEDNNTADGVYSAKQAAWYGEKIDPLTAPFDGSSLNNLVANKNFSCWMLNETAAIAQGYDVEDNGGFVTISKGSLELTFVYSEKRTNNLVNPIETYYLGVTSVQGKGVFVQQATNPIVKAKLNNLYNLTIDNTGDNNDVYWAELEMGLSTLYGAVSSAEVSSDGNDAQTSFVVADADQYAYPFQRNNGLAFYKLNNLNDQADKIKNDEESLINSFVNNAYYYVYNYGHIISGWNITVDGVYHFKHDGTAWTNGSTSLIEKLDGKTFKDLAAYLDGCLVGMNGSHSITITPIWQAVQIKVSFDGAEKGLATFGASYSLITDPTSEGQTFFCYKQGSNLIANNAVWNYVNINTDQYRFAYDRLYYLDVTAVFINNIYKISLNSVYDPATCDLDADNTDFIWATNIYGKTVYTWKDAELVPALTGYAAHGKVLAETYAGEVLNAYLASCADIIDGDDGHEIFKKVYKDGNSLWIYLAHSLNTGRLPMFTHEYAKIIAWKDGNDKSYKTEGFVDDQNFTAELTANYEENIEDITWSLNGANSQTFETIYVYRLNLYYEDNNVVDGIYSTKDASWYGAYTTLTINHEDAHKVEENEIPSNKNFVDWMFNAEGISADDITITATTIKYNGVTFTYGSKSAYHNYYYTISSVTGGSLFIQNADSPIVRARLSNEYNLTIDNTNTYWKNVNVSDLELYGAVSSSEIGGTDDGDYAKTTFVVANNEDYAYPFQVNDGLAFYKLADLQPEATKIENDQASSLNSYVNKNNAYYYIYNYGHHISAWKIRSAGLNVVYDNGWKSGTSTDAFTMSSLTMQQLAAYLDDYFAGTPGTHSITLIPEWDEVAIKAVESSQNKTVISTTFAADYVVFEALPAPMGQTLFAYDYDNDNVIATAAKWNYQNIPHGEMAYDLIGNGYTLNVSPIWLDDIFKINLTNVKIADVNTYLLSDCDYSFNARVGSYRSSSEKRFNFRDLPNELYTYADYNTTLVDEYIDTLKDWRDLYVANIADGGFEIFRKVYYSAGTVGTTNDQTPNDTLTASVEPEPEFWMYLANGQNTGALPAFEKQYYTHIYWENVKPYKQTNKNYVYVTNKYQTEFHAAEIKAEHLTHKDSDGINFVNIWYYEDGYDSSDSSVTFNAYYFRKFYNLEIETYVDQQIERRGYVHVYVKDNVYQIDSTVENRGGNFIIIAENGVMKVYKLNNGVDGSKNKIAFSTLDEFVDTAEDYNLNTDYLTDSNTFKLYGGCDVEINVKDQSQDYLAMHSGIFDEMIGYKFNGRIEQTNPTENKMFEDLEQDELYDYINSFDALEIENQKYANDEIISIDVYFEKIVYNLNLMIDDIYAGEFNTQTNATYSGYQKSYKLENVTVANFYQVYYFAFAGYKLKPNAFVITNKANSVARKLQGYNETDNESPEYYKQDYIMTGGLDGKYYNLSGSAYLDGIWLRTFFYNDQNYDVDLVDLGTLTIQTEKIVFDYGVKVYDETTGTIANKYIIDEIEDGTLSLTNGEALTNSVATYLNDDKGFWSYRSSVDATDYALLTSRLYFPNNYLTQTDNYYTSYNFLLKTEPVTQFKITSHHLSKMLNNYESGKIVECEDRNIYIMLEVRKLFEIKIKVDATNPNDTNDTVRTTTVKNTNTNAAVVTVNQNTTTSGSYYYTATGSTEMTLHTYLGLENSCVFEMDENRYSDVEFRLNGEVLESGSFTVDQDSNLIIEYIPKGLNVEFVYTFEGTEIDLAELADYITEDEDYKPATDSIFYLTEGYNKVPYKVASNNEDYNVRVTINGVIKGTTTDEIRELSLISDGVNDSRYQVLNTDFDKGVITILVDVFKKNTQKINVNFQLVNSAKMCADDDYGTFTIYTPLDAENRVLAEDETSIEVEVIEARDVYVTLNLKTGYIFKGYKHAAYNAQETTLDANNTFLLIADFNPSVHYGDYLILIDKISINATLDVTDLEAQYYINGKTELSGLYVGSTIEFSNVDVDTERLGCFYYTYVDGETKTVYLTEDGTSTDENLTTSLTITSEFLETTKLLETQDKTIKFGVVAINRYKLNIVLLGSEYLAENGFTTNYCDASGASCVIEEEYKLGDYCDAGTQITFSVIPLNVGKYNVEFDGNIYNSINSGEKVITLDKDYTYVIKITPKTFVVSLDEYVYNDLYQVIEGNPELVESGHVNNMQHQGQNYKDNAEIEFVRNASDRQLSAIYISGNDNVDQYIIVFDGENFVVYLNDIEEDNIVYLTEYAITLTAYGTIKLTYTTNNDISLRLEYKDYKFINVG